MRTSLAMLLLAALNTPLGAAAGEVIAHPSVSLSVEEVRDVFLGEKQLTGSLKLVPVDNAALQPEFLARVLQTDARKYTARWTKKAFREGLVAPALKGSDAEVLSFVKSTPGAVGYVGRSADGVKILERF